MPISRRQLLLSLVPARRPNILFCIADDQSYPADGLPAFARVAANGVTFRNAYSLSPGCAPSRAGLLTGRYPWQLGEAGTHAAGFPRDLVVYPDLLAKAGYHIGITGKGAGPANFARDGWPHNPAGPAFNQAKLTPPNAGIQSNDYAANFARFLEARAAGQPFYFWFGCQEPHRAYEPGAGLRAGKRLADAKVPPHLPDNEIVRSDLLDYQHELEHFDTHLGRMLDLLAQKGELENTLVVVTADNGMPFPGAKATMFDAGIHLPLAMQYPAQVKGGRVVDDLVSFADFAPTLLEAAGVAVPANMVGRSLLPLLRSGRSGLVEPKVRRRIFSGRERHSHARRDNLGYPARAMREGRWLYIWNMRPDRWPAGDPIGNFADIDDGATKTWMMAHRDHPLFARSFGLQPEELLFDVEADPGCLRNLAGEPGYAKRRKELRTTLERELKRQGDPRLLGQGDIWESYPRYSPMRKILGGFAEEGKYNPSYSGRQ
jgi:uncharacterized sulfatase